MTPCQRKLLSEAAANWLGVAKLRSTGLGRSAQRRMASALCEAGLMERYVHGDAEYRITSKGRAALSAPSTDAKVRG